VVECGGLENRYVGNPGVGGSNPPLSAFQHAAFGGLSASQHAQAFGFRLSARRFAPFQPISRDTRKLKC
jgi:hypothetical protein